MRNNSILSNRMLLFPIVLSLLAAAVEVRSHAGTSVTLSDARFEGLTRIVVSTNRQLTGIDAAAIVITRPDGAVVRPEKITGIEAAPAGLSVTISADQFARITSEGTTIATRPFGAFRAARAVKVRKLGESSANGHIIGSSAWTDEGWSTSRTDPAFMDPVTGQKGLYRFTDTTPDRDEKGAPLAWKDGRILTPARRNKNMLVLFVEFPDRRAADAGDPYTTFSAYMSFLSGASDWFEKSSYGQFRLTISSPQETGRRGWIMMGKNAAQYPWDGQTHNMFAYVREACQLAYDNLGIKADEYDMLLVMPARGKPGLFNGPGNINRDPTDGAQPNTNLVAYVDRENKPHYIDTALTAGNDMFRWGYRWLIHEAGHAFGFPDLYMYAPTVNGARVGSFFYCGGWDMMGNIAGHSTDFLAWHKWKLRWIRDDQVDVVSRAAAETTKHFVTPVETPGGAKMTVIRTGLSTAYVVEFRTRLGVNALDSRGKYSGVLIYRIDAARWEARGTNPTAQIISRQYYRSPVVGESKNLTGVWRPIENSVTGYDSPDCCWQPGDVFSDPATGVTIRVDGITHCTPADPSGSPYTGEDVATISVFKSTDAVLSSPVVLSNARLKDLTELTVDTNVEMQVRFPNANAGNKGTYTYVREGSALTAENLVITRSNGSVVPAGKIGAVTINQDGVVIALEKGAFSGAREAAGATVATRPYYNYGAGGPVKISVMK